MAISLNNLANQIPALGNLILVSPQSTLGYQPKPKNKGDTPPPALLFHYEGEQTASIESDITDHFVEDNTSIQDQISLKPEIITTHGFIGELNDVAPTFLRQLQTLANRLTVITAYTPQISATALLAYNTAFFAYQNAQLLANVATNAFAALSGQGGENVIGANGLVTSLKNQTKQQTYFQQFYSYWRQRYLFTVQTPWAVFENMAIKSLRAIQDAETDVITDFEITFKMIRLANTQVSEAQLDAQGRLISQGAFPVNLGVSVLSDTTPFPIGSLA